MVKIVVNKDKTTYRVVDEACIDIPESRGKIFSTALEAVNAWLYPNNDESGVAKFLAEVPVIEEEPMPESQIGKIPHGNIINIVMGRGQSPSTYYALTNWVLQVLGYEDGSADSSIPCVGYGELSGEFIAELNRRVEKIEDVSLLLTIMEMADAGKRGCRGDKYNDAICRSIIEICLTKLQGFDLLPPSLWHKVHRHALWQESAETEVVTLPSPEGWVSFSGVRPAQHGAWSVRMNTPTGSHESPQYVTKMGLKAKNQNQYAKSHTGVECRAFHLFNADGTLWGFEVYLISPKKTVGCEVTKDGRFSLFRSGVYLSPRLIGVVRQGDALFQRIDVQKEDVTSIVDLPGDTPWQMQSVTIHGVVHEKCTLEIRGEEHRHDGYGYFHPMDRVHIIEDKINKYASIEVGRKEHRHEGYDYWHPITRCHADSTPYPNNPNFPCIPTERTDSSYKYENVLILNEDAVLMHPDHPSISLKAGYYQILPVEGETDYRPPQRRGD